MQLVKIHELPSISYDRIKDTDICIIENTDDTYNIPVADLKLIFSNDAKIQAFYNQLLNMIQSLGDTVNESTLQFTQMINNIMNKVETMEENVSNMDGRIVVIEGDIRNINNTLTSLDEDLSNLAVRVSNNETAIDDHSRKLTSIQNTVNTHTQDITNLKAKDINLQNQIDELNRKLQSLSLKVDSLNAVSIDTINQIKIEIENDIKNKYEEIMQIIDDKFHQTPIICDEY